MNTDSALASYVSSDPACPYHPACECYKQPRFQFGYGHVGQKGDYDRVMLTRDGVADVMADLIANPTVDRMWIEVDGRNAFMWFCPVTASRIGDWVADFEGHPYCFRWDVRSESVYCTTLGETFNQIDPFGYQRWNTHLGAVLWTLDNLGYIACPR